MGWEQGDEQRPKGRALMYLKCGDTYRCFRVSSDLSDLTLGLVREGKKSRMYFAWEDCDGQDFRARVATSTCDQHDIIDLGEKTSIEEGQADFIDALHEYNQGYQAFKRARDIQTKLDKGQLSPKIRYKLLKEYTAKVRAKLLREEDFSVEELVEQGCNYGLELDVIRAIARSENGFNHANFAGNVQLIGEEAEKITELYLGIFEALVYGNLPKAAALELRIEQMTGIKGQKPYQS